MKLVLGLLIAFSFVFVLSSREPNVKFTEVDLEIMKKLSLPARAVMMSSSAARVSGSNPRRTGERRVGISAQVAGPSPLASKFDMFKSSFKPKTRKSHGHQDQLLDDMATLTRMFQLMLETLSDSASKNVESNSIVMSYSSDNHFGIGENLSKCDLTVNVLKEAGSIIKVFSQNLTQLDHVDAYERITLLSEQLTRDCNRASEYYDRSKKNTSEPVVPLVRSGIIKKS